MPKAKAKPKAEENGAALRLEWRDPAELAENPRNWRRHPEPQMAALTDVLAEVGWAGACLYNERTGRLIDGHARRKVALEQGAARVPVLVGDWDEAQEATILATLDPLGAMAQADNQRLGELLRELRDGGAALDRLGWPDHKADPILAADWSPPAVEDGDFGSRREDDDEKAAPLALTPGQREALNQAAAACREANESPDLTEGECVEFISRR
jgi:ParB-like chromosome segregation protein Spo0J